MTACYRFTTPVYLEERGWGSTKTLHREVHIPQEGNTYIVDLVLVHWDNPPAGYGDQIEWYEPSLLTLGDHAAVIDFLQRLEHMS